MNALVFMSLPSPQFRTEAQEQGYCRNAAVPNLARPHVLQIVSKQAPCWDGSAV